MNNVRMIDKVYGDIFHLSKEKEITIISFNVNRLRTEEQTAKNDIIRDLILNEADIVSIQQTNVNQNKVAWKDL